MRTATKLRDPISFRRVRKLTIPLRLKQQKGCATPGGGRASLKTDHNRDVILVRSYPVRRRAEMLSLIWWFIVGLIAGGLARLLMPGKDPMSLFATILLESQLLSWAVW